ncbi:hypothetical protein BT63DRAFT_423814 [Microthyrium microscopicum]|uniref:DUF6924 domain-containing protein n=1 Tax=Microthyrium microscopicum TaxID=703497 RepID=A0A6A6UG19_9PEZI|nr:hypothetical protein BT63DRAFT_423814 [Microthyrium microscopicum]
MSIPLFCIEKISADRLTTILTLAYEGSPDTDPDIIFINDLDIPSGPEPKDPSLSIPAINEYPFLGKTTTELGAFITKFPEDWSLFHDIFLVADKQTAENDSLLLVQNLEPEETVRLAAEHANAIPIAIRVATMDIGGVQSLVDEDGIYRGGRSGGQVKKGGPAPRKQLANGN